MKNVLRFTIAGFFACVMALSIAGEAHAVKLKHVALKWRDQAGGLTDRQNLAVGVNDTTQVIDTEGWAIPNFMVSASATVADSLPVAWIILSHDSSAAYTPSATSGTIVIEGTGVNGNNNSFSPMATTTFTDPTTTDLGWRIPIFINPTLLRGDMAKAPGLGNVWPRIRMRIVTIGGTFSSCRVSVTHFTE